MLAINRTIRQGVMNAFEFLCIVERNGGLVYAGGLPPGGPPLAAALDVCAWGRPAAERELEKDGFGQLHSPEAPDSRRRAQRRRRPPRGTCDLDDRGTDLADPRDEDAVVERLQTNAAPPQASRRKR